MAATYDYNNRQITRDFHFVEYDEKCRRMPLPAKAGNDWCRRCPHNAGSVHPSSFGFEYWGWFEKSYVKCKHPEAKDSEDSNGAIRAFHEALEHAALCALCY